LTVLELEPQTLWEKVVHAGRYQYRENRAALERVCELPQAKLMHGIGQPLGGTVPDPVAHLPLLVQTADLLDAVWVSEHLSFNRVRDGIDTQEAGFLMPPPQHAAGVRVAARNVVDYGRALSRPVAFETGVNYLRPDGGMSDGEYWRAVADATGCGILLDLHNLWCNEVNGRGRVLDVIDQLPLERVWEVHLAGGMPMAGYWLDAHSGRVPEPLLAIAAEVLPRLPGLGALMFEVMPEHVHELGQDGVAAQVEQLAALWRLRPPARVNSDSAPQTPRDPVVSPPSADDVAQVRAWELALHRLVSTAVAGEPGMDPAVDPGIEVYRTLIHDVRRGALAQTMHYTLTLLLLAVGSRTTAELLSAFFADCPPEAYRALEADHFASFVKTRPGVLDAHPHLPEVLDYEHALIRATVRAADTRIEWTADPTTILAALDRGQLPPALPRVQSEMVVTGNS
jgi:uncharacterized protein (UPF0276 family)